MKVYNTDGSVLMQISAVERDPQRPEIVFRGSVMGTLPVKGRLLPGEVRQLIAMLLANVNWLFLVSFLFRRSRPS